jgi:AcrR family transcriptional regulator
MPQNKDPLARDRQASKTKGHLAAHVPPIEAVDERALKVWKLRTEDRLTPAEIAKRLKIPIYTVYRDLNNKHQLIMAAMSQYGQFRRNENERELEDFKAMCASYMYDPNVVIRGEKVDSDGKPRMVDLSKFEAMVRVGQLWLSAMNMQNKMWGLYTVSEQAPQQDAPGTMVNIKNVSIAIVEELQKIARRANVPLRIEDKDEEPRPRPPGTREQTH